MFDSRSGPLANSTTTQLVHLYCIHVLAFLIQVFGRQSALTPQFHTWTQVLSSGVLGQRGQYAAKQTTIESLLISGFSRIVVQPCCQLHNAERVGAQRIKGRTRTYPSPPIPKNEERRRSIGINMVEIATGGSWLFFFLHNARSSPSRTHTHSAFSISSATTTTTID